MIQYDVVEVSPNKFALRKTVIDYFGLRKTYYYRSPSTGNWLDSKEFDNVIVKYCITEDIEALKELAKAYNSITNNTGRIM